MRFGPHLAAVAVAAVALVACGDASSSEPVATPASSGRPGAGDPSGTWVMVAGPVDPIPGWDVTVTIDGDSISGTAACNGYGGSVSWDDGAMSVSELSWTEMGCEPAVQTLEQTFLASLGAVTSYSSADERLELVAPDGTWQFEPLPEVPTT